MELGYDGKLRAITGTVTGTVAAPGLLYFGLLSALPADYAGLSMTNLMDVGGADNELDVTNFYIPTTGRSLFTPGTATADENGGIASNSNAITISNSSGSTVGIAGFFISTSSAPASDGSAEVLWVGPALSGSASVDDSADLAFGIGGITLKVK